MEYQYRYSGNQTLKDPHDGEPYPWALQPAGSASLQAVKLRLVAQVPHVSLQGEAHERVKQPHAGNPEVQQYPVPVKALEVQDEGGDGDDHQPDPHVVVVERLLVLDTLINQHVVSDSLEHQQDNECDVN